MGGQSRGVAQLVARLHGVQEVRSSSLLTPTLPKVQACPSTVKPFYGFQLPRPINNLI